MAKHLRGKPALPRYFVWRGGRPRWQPGPAVRAKGFAGRDLKDALGHWLPFWQACEAAEAINKLVDDNTVELARKPQARTLGQLLDMVEALPKFQELPPPAPIGAPTRKVKRLSRDTRNSYLGHFRILRAWGGDMLAAAITPADIEVLYDALVNERGHVMANRCMAAASMVFNHARDKLRWITHNPVAGLEKVPEDGRQVMWSAEENIAFIAAADWMGLWGVADAHIVALMSAQSRIDVLSMPELDLSADVFRLPRHKVAGSTGKPAFVPATRILMDRLRLARARKAQMFPGVTYRHEIIDYRTGAAYNLEGSVFTEQHRMVRAVASGLQQALETFAPHRPTAGHGAQVARGYPVLDWSTAPFTPVPSIWHKRFADLRDTAFTLLLEATQGDIAKVANITAHSLRTVQKVADKHYFVRHEGLSRGAGGQLEQLMARIGYAG